MPAHEVLLMLLWILAGLVIGWIGLRYLFSPKNRTERQLRQLRSGTRQRRSLGGFVLAQLVNVTFAITAFFLLFHWLEGR